MSNTRPLRSWLVLSHLVVFALPVLIFAAFGVGVAMRLQTTPFPPARALLPAAMAALFLTIAMAIWLSHVLSRSFDRLAHASSKMAGGDFAAEADLPQDSRISEAADVATSFATMSTRMRSRMAYILEFASNVSHEFRTPISSMQATLELLEDPEMPPEQRARFLRNAQADTHRMERLLSGLIELARAEERPEVQRVSLTGVMARVSARYPAIHVEGAPGAVMGTAVQLEAALANLIDNARRYGGPNGGVWIVGWVEGDRTGFDVLDNGPGISTANQSKVFERFFTTNREGGGTGLGLPLVRTIAIAHGGEVEMESAPGLTRFRVSLPRVD